MRATGNRRGNVARGITTTSTTSTVHAQRARVDDAGAALDAAAVPENTRRAYRGDWKRFAAWCDAEGRQALPASPATLARYIAALVTEGLARATIERAAAAVSSVHRVAGLASPRDAAAVRLRLRGMRRTLARPQRKAAPIGPAELARMMPEGSSLSARRDRALLLVGFASGLRRSELAALRWGDVVDAGAAGVRIFVGVRKNDPSAKGHTVRVPFARDPALCPVRRLLAWREVVALYVAGRDVVDALDEFPLWPPLSGPYAHSARSIGAGEIARIVHRACVRAGLDPLAYSAHSLRRGLVTSAYLAGKPSELIRRKTGQSLAVLAGYIDDAALDVDDAADGLL